jgi:F-type H+-transporting ATPase subunit gamma
MPAQLQVLRRRIRSVKSTKKITKAQELVATSRIAKAQERVFASRPYAKAITDVLGALARNAGGVEHPLLGARSTVRRSGVLLITSDRGLCGGYNANVIRQAEHLVDRLRGEGKEPVLYVIGRKGVTYYRFRQRPIEASWTGFSERPDIENAREVGQAVSDAFVAGTEDGNDGVDELYLVSTQFKSLMTQTPAAALLAPMQVEPVEGLAPAYEFEPGPEQLLDALLPKYLNTRIYAALLDSAASESASRRRAMKSATDNAEELIKKYTRDMNSARQAAITQEISEIVGGANALAEAGSDV